MKRLLLLCLTAGLLFMSQTDVKAQTYENAIGVRIGSYNGVNFKTFLNSTNALAGST